MQGRGFLLNISMWALRRMLVGVAGLAAWGLVMTGAAHAGGYVCETDWTKYTSCASGYYISNCPSSSSSWTGQQISSSQLTNDNSCRSCPSGFECAGGLYCPEPVAVTTVTITYNLNGGSGTAPASTTCNVGQSCTLASGGTTSFHRAGYVFKGWATSSSATTGTTTITPTANDTLYAVWSACTGYQYKTSSATAAATCMAVGKVSVVGPTVGPVQGNPSVMAPNTVNLDSEKTVPLRPAGGPVALGVDGPIGTSAMHIVTR